MGYHIYTPYVEYMLPVRDVSLPYTPTCRAILGRFREWVKA